MIADKVNSGVITPEEGVPWGTRNVRPPVRSYGDFATAGKAMQQNRRILEKVKSRVAARLFRQARDRTTMSGPFWRAEYSKNKADFTIPAAISGIE